MDVERLRAKMREKNVSILELSELLRIDVSTFYRKIAVDSTNLFSVEQARRIAQKLELDDREIQNIFFG